MTGRVTRVAGLVAFLALASAPAGASEAGRAPVALVASPAHVEIAGSGRTTVRVTNSGTRRVVLDLRRAGFALDLRGQAEDRRIEARLDAPPRAGSSSGREA
jgi:hypothetical protein